MAWTAKMSETPQHVTQTATNGIGDKITELPEQMTEKSPIPHQPENYFFKGKDNKLSNWAPYKILYKELTFNSVEQGYMHLKLMDHKKPELASYVMTLSDPEEIKRIGDTVTESED